MMKFEDSRINWTVFSVVMCVALPIVATIIINL
jgi:hypothetical protein